MAKFLSDDLPPDEWQKRRNLQFSSGDPDGGIDPTAPIWALNDGMPSAEWQRARARQIAGAPATPQLTAKPAAARTPAAAYTKRDAARDLGAGLVLDQLGVGEQKGRPPSYDVTYGYGAFVPQGTKALTEMSFAEVASLQREMLQRQAGAKLSSSAAGKYQFLDDEVERLRKKLGLKETDRFTPGVQDMMAREILYEKGCGDFLSGKIDGRTFQDAIAPKWASVPMSETGKSYHGQPVGMTTDQMQAILAQSKAEAQRRAAEASVDPYGHRWR